MELSSITLHVSMQHMKAVLWKSHWDSWKRQIKLSSLNPLHAMCGVSSGVLLASFLTYLKTLCWRLSSACFTALLGALAIAWFFALIIATISTMVDHFIVVLFLGKDGTYRTLKSVILISLESLFSLVPRISLQQSVFQHLFSRMSLLGEIAFHGAERAIGLR